MVHKLQLAADQLARYTNNMASPAQPLDTHITDTEATVSITIVSVLGTLILLNVFFYLLFKRVSRQQEVEAAKKRGHHQMHETSFTGHKYAMATQDTQNSQHTGSRSEKTMGDLELESYQSDSAGKTTPRGYWSDISQSV